MKHEKTIDEFCSIFAGAIDEKVLQESLCAISAPIPYKGLVFYPVKARYYQFFSIVSSVLHSTKYDSGLPQCMGMNMLQFLFYESEDGSISNAKMYLPLLQILLETCLQISHLDEDGNENIEFWQDGKKCFIKIMGVNYDYKDYEKMRELIAKQNAIELVDYTIHPDVRKLIEEKKRLRAATNGTKIGTFEELVDSLMVVTGQPEEFILDLPIRRFINLIQRYDIVLSYELTTLLSPYIDKKDKGKTIKWNGTIPKEDYFYSNVQKASALENKLKSIQ